MVYSHEMEAFSFQETKYINTHKDYMEHKKNKKFHKCFKAPNNPLSIYNYILNNGTISPRKNQFIEFFVDDVYGNSSTLTFKIDNKQKVPTKALNVGRYDLPVFPFNQRNFFKNDSIKLKHPAKSLYDTIYFDYKMVNDTFSSLYAPSTKYTRITHHSLSL